MISLSRVWAFGGVSAVGWCLDTTLFGLLTHFASAPAGPANAFSATVAVSLVFLVTHERLFGGSRAARRRHLVEYIVVQVLLVLLASLAIGELVRSTDLEPVLVKIAVTPVTLVLNFVTMSLISSGAWRRPRRPALRESS